MIFSTPTFLTLFLPLILVGCWGLAALSLGYGRKMGRAGSPWAWLPVNALLLAASLFFYFWGEGLGVLWLVSSILFNAIFAHVMMAREEPGWQKVWLGLGIAGNLLFLGWFKYADFIAESVNLLPGVSIPLPHIALPLGISFYTFQAMSYLCDVYRRDVKPARNIIDFACYISMFPQLVAGPIVRYVDIAEQLRMRSVGVSGVASGFRRFLCGLAKKVVIANNVGVMADAVWGVIENGHGTSFEMAWMGLICYALQIYYDFSGYSDMAIGMGRMLGFEFKENFRHPYCSSSVREFWRRWHISLSTWFRDYLYIPLGGNRKGTLRTGMNCLIVFALCGLWHGASVMFLLWGLMHGAFLMLERFLTAGRPKPDRAEHASLLRRMVTFIPGHIYTIAVFLFGWVLFRSETLADAGLMLRSLAGLAEVSKESRVLWIDFSPKVILTMGAGIFLAYPIVPGLRAKLGGVVEKMPASGVVVCLLEWVVLTFLGLLSLLFLAGGSYNPFLYFRF